MLPDNMNLLEKYTWNKVDEIEREVQKNRLIPKKLRMKVNLALVPGAVIALTILLLIIF
jgi:hypothetical protein